MIEEKEEWKEVGKEDQTEDQFQFKKEEAEEKKDVPKEVKVGKSSEHDKKDEEPDVPRKKEHHKDEHRKKEHHKHHTHSEGPRSHHEPKESKKKPKRKTDYWKLATLVLIVLLGISIFTNGFSTGSGLSKDEAAAKTLDFVNTNLLQGQTATIKSVTEEKGVYNLKLSVTGQEVDSYITKDGVLFFPQVINMEEGIPQPPAQPQTPPEVTKSDKPEVELFVMSHCPYGTQAVKGMIPAVEKLGDKIDFDLKFVYYAMHGEVEVNEQMNQVCIQEEQNDKFNDYLKCFLENGDGQACIDLIEIDETKLTACVERIDAEFGMTASLEDQSTWLSGRFPLFNVHKEDNELYDVGGSPSLVINGQSVSSGRSPADYLITICAAFNEAPEECDAELSATPYSAGFGYDIGADTIASCG